MLNVLVGSNTASILLLKLMKSEQEFGLVDLGLVSPVDPLLKMNGTPSRYHASFEIVTKLNSDDVAALRTESPVRKLLEFVDELIRIEAKSATAATP